MTTSALGVFLAANASPMTLDGTRTFVVGVERPVVIDPGPDDPHHLETVRATLGGVRPEAIILTHLHPDHAAGAATLARLTGARVLAGEGAAAPLHGLDLDSTLGDGDEIATDRGVLRAVPTPGHAPEHLALHWTGDGAPAGGAAFVGDLMMGTGDTTLVAAPEGDVGAYLESLDRIAALRARVLHPSHGPAIEDPAAAIERYRAHRLERIEQVRTAAAAHPSAGAAELVDLIYGDTIPPGLRKAARGSVEAMLAYLADTA